MNYYIRYWSQDTQESGRWLVLPYSIRRLNFGNMRMNEIESKEGPKNTANAGQRETPCHVNVDALENLLESLDTTAQQMRETGELMRAFKAHPVIQRHGSELRGASEMVDEWINGITRELSELST